MKFTGKLQVPVYMQNSGCLHAKTHRVEKTRRLVAVYTQMVAPVFFVEIVAVYCMYFACKQPLEI